MPLKLNTFADRLVALASNTPTLSRKNEIIIQAVANRLMGRLKRVVVDENAVDFALDAMRMGSDRILSAVRDIGIPDDVWIETPLSAPHPAGSLGWLFSSMGRGAYRVQVAGDFDGRMGAIKHPVSIRPLGRVEVLGDGSPSKMELMRRVAVETTGLGNIAVGAPPVEDEEAILFSAYLGIVLLHATQRRMVGWFATERAPDYRDLSEAVA